MKSYAIWASLLLMGGMAITEIATAQPQGTQVVDIGSMEVGQEPAGFTTWRTGEGSPAEWRVVDDPSATRQKAVAQTSKDTTDYRFPLAVYQPVSARNVEVSVRFKPVAGKLDQAGGIAVRLTTPDDYYVVRANALENNVRFYRVLKGKREEIQGTSTKVAGNQWHTLGLRAEEDRFIVSFDGKPLFTAQDKTFSRAGKIALWTKADSVTYFDTITITQLD
jgi:hypothetical protein